MIDNNNTDEVAKFFLNLGQESLLRCTYETEAANTWPSRISPTFAELNYSTNSSYLDISLSSNIDIFMRHLRFGSSGENKPQPIILRALNKSGGAGHAFVVDGEMTREFVTMRNGMVISAVPLNPLYHVIWGWDGRYNGYYTFSKSSDAFSEEAIFYDNAEEEGLTLPRDYFFHRIYSGMLPNR